MLNTHGFARQSKINSCLCMCGECVRALFVQPQLPFALPVTLVGQREIQASAKGLVRLPDLNCIRLAGQAQIN